MSRTILQLICPPHKASEKMTNCCKFCLYPEKKRKPKTPLPPSGPTPLGPHCFRVVVCAVCAAPDSAVCCCFSCCLCSRCGLLLPLFLLLLVLVAAFGPSTVEHSSPPTFAVFDLPKRKNYFLQQIETKFAGISTNFNGAPPSSPPHHHPSEPHTSWP